MGRSIALAAIVAAVLSATAPYAAMAQNVVVGGNILQTTRVGDNSVSAFGLSSAKNNINAIDNVRVGGDLIQTVTVGNNDVVADYGSTASNDIGGLYNSRISGDVDRSIRVGNVSTRATFILTDAKTRIGTVSGANVSGDMKQTIAIGNVVTHARHFDTDAVTCIGTSIGAGVGPTSVSKNQNFITKSKQEYIDTWFGDINLGAMFGDSNRFKLEANGC